MRKKLPRMLLTGIVSVFLLSNVGHAEWKASASSVQNEEHSANASIDGDLTTRWSSEFKDDQWLEIDFGKSMKVENVTLYWEAAYTKKYEILTSKNGSSWESVYATENGKGGQEQIKIKPVSARYVKLKLDKRATEWGNSLFEIQFNQSGAAGGSSMKATASSGDGDYSPDKALDGNMGTRWSSNFNDTEWWQVEFEKPRKLCGIVIQWETAFGEAYNVQAAGEDGRWEKVYETAEGDGNRDIIYFKPVTAKKLKIAGKLRGTGWGFSFWEVTLLDGENPPVLSANSSLKENPPQFAMDGDRTTQWHSGKKEESDITIELPRTWNLGGVVLTWGEDYAISYTMDISPDGKVWKEVQKTEEGNGKVDEVFFDPFNVKFIRIKCLKSANGNGYALAEVEVKGNEEKASPIKLFQSLAKDEPSGFYPIWLRRVQEFWTVVGVRDDEAESLVSERGTIEPSKGGFSLLPFIFEGKNVYTSEECTLDQSLLENKLPIPTVSWKRENWNLNITAFTYGPAGSAQTLVRYRFKNEGKEKFSGNLALAGLPVQLNPIWQSGGLSPINKVECAKENEFSVVKINGNKALVSATEPAGMGATPFKSGNVVTFIKKGTIPANPSTQDGGGLASFGILYKLEAEPGETKDIVLSFPLSASAALVPQAKENPSDFFNKQLESTKNSWSDIVNQFDIEIPEMRLIDMLKTNIAYILINKDGPWIKPGSRNYSHSWVRDGAMTCVALLRVGLIDDVRIWIESVTRHIDNNGMVPYIFFQGGNPVGFNYGDFSGEAKEFDSQGEYVFAVRQYYDFTRDKTLLDQVYPKIVKALKFTQDLRRQRMKQEYMTDPNKRAYYGILPLSNSHEGYYPAKHSYWDDFWGLRGFKDGIHLAEVMRREDDSLWMQKELEDFRGSVLESIKKVMEQKKIEYIPGCVELGDYDPTSTSIAIMAAEEENYLPKKNLDFTFDKYFKDFVKRLEPGGEVTFTPYEVRNANTFIRMGQRKKALTMLRYFLKDSVRPYGWNHMAEVVHARPRAASYIGDMPHTWVGSGYISTVRTMFVYEKDGKLIVAAGVDPQWFEKGVKVKDLPTMYGKINYSINQKGDAVEFILEGAAKPPEGFVIPLPEELKDYRASVNNKEAAVENGNLSFPKLPARIKLYK